MTGTGTTRRGEVRDAITVVGGGVAGLVTAVTAAELGARVRLLEAHADLGGRARSAPPPFVANEGPHVIYGDGAFWAWLVARDLARPYRRVPAGGTARIRFRHEGRTRLAPPAGLLRLLARRRLRAPVDEDFRSWAAGVCGERTAEAATSLAGVVTFTADPGRLSAAFVWERLLRVTNPLGGPRYVGGAWSGLTERLAGRARELGVTVETGVRAGVLPDGPVVLATSLAAARGLLGRPLATPATAGATQLLDVGLRRGRGDAFIVFDLDECGFLEEYARADPALAPAGAALVQVQRPLREGEDRAAAVGGVERLLEAGAPGWGERVLWRRDASARGRSGALDLPGFTWRDRPAIDQGDGVFLAGDEVAAPGMLGEVSHASALVAARAAVAALRPGRPTHRS